MVPMEDSQDITPLQTPFLACWCTCKCDTSHVTAKILTPGTGDIQGRMWKHLSKDETYLAGSSFYTVV